MRGEGLGEVYQHQTIEQFFCNFVYVNFNFNAQTDVIYTDFSKAFDKVNHTILLKKLHEFGFNDNMILWFRSYLLLF